MIAPDKNNFYITMLIYFIISAGSVLMCRCSTPGLTGSETGNPTVISSAALIKMPTSLTGFFPVHDADNAISIYNIIRKQNQFVNELVNGEGLSVKNWITFINDSIPWNYIQQIGSFKDTSPSGVYFEASYKQSDSLKYLVVLGTLPPLKIFKIKALFNGSAINPVGWVYYYIGKPDSAYIDSLQIRVDFSKLGTEKKLAVAIVQYLDSAATPQQKRNFTRSFKYSLYEENAIIHLSASTCLPYLDSILKDTVGYNYTYTALADTITNRAIVNLGIPPKNCTSNDSLVIFDTYGIANIYGKAFVYYYMQSLTELQKRIVVTSYKENMRIDTIFLKIAGGDTAFLHPSSEIETMTVSDLKLFLEINKELDPNAFADLLWILKLDQPVYFNFLGYVGNGKKVPPGFETLAAIKCNRPIFVPWEVATMTITGRLSAK